ncbi:MAG: ABC transporter permease [Gemmatimonadota bacterium]|nr:MAG: ABC transporter permease [Gemmatimonadota bacterium]
MDIWQDVKYGARALRRSKGLIAIAVLSLGIGIGANTSIFSAVDVFMLRPLPYPESDKLYTLWVTNPERGWDQVSFSVPDFVDVRERSQTMAVAAIEGQSFNLSAGDGRPERLRGLMVTSDFFDVLRVQPTMGRGFTAQEEEPGYGKVAIISDGLWRRRFAADPEILSRQLNLDGESYSVVGVMPEGFYFADLRMDIWTPFVITGEEGRSAHYVDVIGRLRDGSSETRATEELKLLMRQLEQEYPESNAGMSGWLLSLHEDVFDEGFKMGSLISTVAVAFVLLIACANVANLLLTHAAGRETEVALRGALGAGRIRIARQFLTEALLVSIMGGVLGLGLSVFGIRALKTLMPPWFPMVDQVGIDARVLAFTAAVTILTGILFGLAPALQGSRANMVDSLKEGGRRGTAGRGMRLRKALVIGEISLALVLLVSSVLLVQGFVRIRLVDLGFDRTDVLTFRVALPERTYPDTAAVSDFYTQLASGIEALPGVDHAAAMSGLPLQGTSATYYTLPGVVAENDLQRMIAGFKYVTPGYFDAMDIQVIKGRDFAASDRVGMPRVILISQAMAELHWPDSDPLGKQLEFFRGPREVVGVVANVNYGGATSTVRPMVYFPALQGAQRTMAWVVESSVPPQTLVDGIRGEIRALDSELPAYQIATLDAAMEEALGGDTVMAKIMAVLAAIALFLALAGVYGVMGYTVSQRTQELGIRMALGAQTNDVLAMVVRQGALLALVGVAIGVGIALGVTRGLAEFLFGVSPFDPITYSAAAVTLLLAGLVAAYFPARRATRVDPIEALRSE